MDYFNSQILPHLQSPSIYCFGVGLAIATCVGKKLLHRYQKKLDEEFNENQHELSYEPQKKEIKHKKINANNTIYFFMHFVFNMYCTYNCWSNVNSLIHNPQRLEIVPNTMGVYVPLLHLYHIVLCGRKIKTDELLHHMWVLIICPLMCINYSNLSDMGMFFTTGIAGGITYLLLFLKNLYLVDDITEKWISMHLNMWVRAPGCILTSYFTYLNYVNNNFTDLSPLYHLGVILCMVGTYMNGIYFGSTIIESYGVTKYKHKLNNAK
jgi:hypothetical protein